MNDVVAERRGRAAHAAHTKQTTKLAKLLLSRTEQDRQHTQHLVEKFANQLRIYIKMQKISDFLCFFIIIRMYNRRIIIYKLKFINTNHKYFLWLHPLYSVYLNILE